MKDTRSIRAGFVGFGEVNTPRELLNRKCADAAQLLEQGGMELARAGLVTDTPDGSDSDRAVRALADAGDPDLLIICVAGWIPSWAVFRVIEPFRHKPMLLLGLTGWREGDRFITTADQAGTTALRSPMEDMGYRFCYLPTYRGEPLPLARILAFARAARAATLARTGKIGMAGYRDMRLYGTLYDGISLKATTGLEIEHFDLLELFQKMREVHPERITQKLSHMRERWKFLKEPREETMENSARFAIAVRDKIEECGWDGFSFSDVDGVKKLFGFAPAGAMTLLHDEIRICSVPENDALGAATQLLVHYLTGQVAAYLEFYEFTREGALMGVPDYVPAEIVDGDVTVLPNAFGDFGEGLLNVSKIRAGKITLCRLGYSQGEYVMHVITGEARPPIRWEEAGWAPPAPQLPSLDMVFDDHATEDFIQRVLSQHYILAYGDIHEELTHLCRLMKIRLAHHRPG